LTDGGQSRPGSVPEGGWYLNDGPDYFINAPWWHSMPRNLWTRLRYGKGKPSNECGYPPGTPEYEAYQEIVRQAELKGARRFRR
jgi:hypothetical protein